MKILTLNDIQTVGQCPPNCIDNADCLEAMKYIADKSIDCILTDLPYGTTACKWDTIIPFEPLWEQYKRIIKDNGAIVLTASQPFTSALVMSNIKMFKYCWYWIKERPVNVLQIKKRAGKNVEDILVFYNKQCKYNPQKTEYRGKLRTNKIKNGSLGKLIDSENKKAVSYKDDRTRYPLQTLFFQRDILKSNIHPTQKPVALFEYLIKTYTSVGDTVLDNCAGSFTTAVACENLKRNWICIEKETEYCEIGRKRIDENRKRLLTSNN